MDLVGGDPLEEYYARRQTRDRRDREGEAVYAAGVRMWDDLLAGPVITVAPQWSAVWAEFAAALSNDFSPQVTADAFAAVDVLLGELHGHWAAWSAANAGWRRDFAEPWNRAYGGGFGFVPYPLTPPWLVRWVQLFPPLCPIRLPPPDRHGPAGVPRQVSRWVDWHFPPSFEEDRELTPFFEAVHLFGRLGRESGVGSADGLSRLTHRPLIAVVTLILGAIVLPVPGVLAAFLAGHPPAAAVTLAGQLLRTAGAEVGEELAREFDALLVPPEPPPAPPPAAAVGPVHPLPPVPVTPTPAIKPRLARSLAEKAKSDDRARLKLAVYERVRREPGGPKAILDRLKADRQFREQVGAAGLVLNRALIRAARRKPDKSGP